MIVRARNPDRIGPEIIDLVTERLRNSEGLKIELPGGGRLHIDRPLPFLCVYRRRGASKSASEELLTGEASFLLVPASKSYHAGLSKLVSAIVETLAAKFEGFLILEIWASSMAELAKAEQLDALKPTELRPRFVIASRGPNTPAQTVETLRQQLSKTSYLKQKSEVVVEPESHGHPPDLPSLLSSARYAKLGCETIGLGIRPIYRSLDSEEVFPSVLRTLRKNVGRALKQAFFTFAKSRTNAKPKHYYSLGRHAIVKAVLDADRRLCEVSDSFSFLLQATPVNSEAAWQEFRRSKFQKIPKFYYRPLTVDPGLLKRSLFSIAVEKIEDPTLAELYRQRRDELDSKISMLSDVGTPRFRLASQLVYGLLDRDLIELAKQLLGKLGSRTRDEASGGRLTVEQFADLARNEIEYYKSKMPTFDGNVVIRDDLHSGLMCSNGDLLMGPALEVPVTRANALIQHEVGTHLLTYYNGKEQSFRLLSAGFAGYDALQEGLAVLSEFLVGGLSRPRLRLLAARVVAVDAMLQGASFIETFRLLDLDYDFSQRAAYTVTMRVYRGGGLTKDAVYLRGLVEILDYLGSNGELHPLFTGKIATDHISLVSELMHRKVVVPPTVRPRYLEDNGCQQKLEWLAQGRNVMDLVKELTK